MTDRCGGWSLISNTSEHLFDLMIGSCQILVDLIVHWNVDTIEEQYNKYRSIGAQLGKMLTMLINYKPNKNGVPKGYEDDFNALGDE